MDAESMDFWLQQFIMEAKKKKGGDYPSKSLYYIVCGLIRHLRDMNVNDKHFLDEKDGRFAPFRRVLDAKIKDLLSKGLGTKTRKADPISHEDEELLWVNGVFGKSSATTLQYIVFYYNCKLFGLRGREEHRNLDCDQFEIDIDSTGKLIGFMGRNNKTFKGGLGHMQLANKDIKHYSQGGPRCIIAYFEEYLKAVGSGTFYRKPLNMIGKDRFRYGKSVLGVNKLHGLMRELCTKGGLLGHDSFRKTHLCNRNLEPTRSFKRR
ncbi:unnamed protein product [Mytilus coruscus]|uniref:Uncharacterized protein n=1 Tax=Mytilus coruscus TaxID=42192 RepID=A0A6J8DS95_MYTCO|nr:unnamed protein product [Mytilus coruscus]